MRLYQRSADRRPDPDPLPTDDRRAVLAGMALWALVLVVLLLARGGYLPTVADPLAAAGREWWVWTPVTGILLGVLGLRYVSRTTRR